MARNSLEGIIYQHVIYGASTILTGRSSIKSALIQPDELEAAIAYAKPLFEAEDERQAKELPESNELNESNEYSYEYVHSDLGQILDLYNATVTDGRYIDDLATNPKSVAAKLGIEFSDSAASALKQAGAEVGKRFSNNFALTPLKGKKIVAIVIVVGIAIRAEKRPYEIIVDSSGLVKV